MKEFSLATYSLPTGPRAAVVSGGLLYDAATLTGHAGYDTVLSILVDWERAEPALRAAEPASEGMKLSEAKLHAPLLYPGAIYCCGANYQDHMDAIAKRRGLPVHPSPRAMGVGPFHFLKAPRCVVGPDAEVLNESRAFDYEIELAVVIGRQARSVSVDEALDYVAGYTIANDFSARDRTLRPQLPETSPFRYDWGSHKIFDGSCPLGPYIVPRSMIPDPQNLTLKTWVNDQVRQDSTTDKMIYSVAEQIEALTKYNTLYPGDIILTGTPAGVGAETDEYLTKGDRVRMEISGLGELVTMIV